METKQEKKAGRNWPVMIVAVLVLFGGYILYMVFQAMKSDVDLVRKDYYEQTLTYQDQIDNVERSNALSVPITIVANHSVQYVTVQFPQVFADKTVSGNIQLFRPSDKDLDVELPLQLDANQRQLINTSQLQKGLWRVKIHSQAEGQKYFVEKDIMVE
jgi:nitrogen fixation protein FixH